MPASSSKPKKSAEAGAKLEFSVDPRLELDGVMELLAFDLTGGGKSGRDGPYPDIEYVRAARKYFAPYKSHPAIKHRALPSSRAFDLGQRGQGLMRLSPLPELKPHSQISIAFLAHYVGGDAELERWLQHMRDFAIDSKFMGFFNAKKGLLDADLAKLKSEIEAADYIGKIERYTGLPFVGRYAFVLSPFVSSDTGANIVQRGDDGLADIISVVGPTEPTSGPLNCTYHRLHARIWHEAAHGVLDNVTELYGEEIARKQPAQKKATREYQNWMHHVREHMVRSVMLRLVSLEISAALSDNELKHEEECGLPTCRRSRSAWPNTRRPQEISDVRRLLPCACSTCFLRRRRASPHARSIGKAIDIATGSPRTRCRLHAEPASACAVVPRSHAVPLAPAGLLLKRVPQPPLGRTKEALKDAEGAARPSPKDEGALRISRRKAPRPGPRGREGPAGERTRMSGPAELKKLNATASGLSQGRP